MAKAKATSNTETLNIEQIAETLETIPTAMSASEMSEALESSILEFSEGDIPVKPLARDYITEDGDLSPDYHSAIAEYNIMVEQLESGKSDKIKRQFAALIVPIAYNVINALGLQGAYINNKGEVKYYKEALIEQVTEKSHANSAAKVLLNIRDGSPWTDKGAILKVLIPEIQKIPEFKNKTEEWIRNNAKDKREEFIKGLISLNPEKYSRPS